ncbi:unnamed protein product [Effrenium voratum]|nr:unnamed protein product [Effrenium voratum]
MFELVRHPSYVDIKFTSSPRESQCSAIASLVTGIGPTRLSQLEPLAPQGLPLADLVDADCQASNVSVCSSAPLEMLKYQNHSSDWMRRLEGQAMHADVQGRTVQSLKKSLTALSVRPPKKLLI